MISRGWTITILRTTKTMRDKYLYQLHKIRNTNVKKLKSSAKYTFSLATIDCNFCYKEETGPSQNSFSLLKHLPNWWWVSLYTGLKNKTIFRCVVIVVIIAFVKKKEHSLHPCLLFPLQSSSFALFSTILFEVLISISKEVSTECTSLPMHLWQYLSKWGIPIKI
jgi:hypothetical protein